MTSYQNLALVRIARRAERQDDATLAKTFVDFGAVVASLSARDHHILFGRRGTGKTHLLTVLRKTQEDAGTICIQIDMRNLGSTGGIYSDPSIPLAQRATRLLIDVLAALHDRMFELAVSDGAAINLGLTGPALDEFFDAHRSVKVVGTTTLETAATGESSATTDAKLGVSASIKNPSVSVSASAAEGQKETVSSKKTVVGNEVHRVNFGNVGSALRRVVQSFPEERLWILIDEWSEVPLDLQPLLADLLRRAILPIGGVTVKIAAIEQRSRFTISDETVGHIGIELGADVSTAVNLDDYMVFDNDSKKAMEFFGTLIFKHAKAELEALRDEKVKASGANLLAADAAESRAKTIDEGPERAAVLALAQEKRKSAIEIQNQANAISAETPDKESVFISSCFTQVNAFEEVVRACEGVPRDAINILSTAAQHANDGRISVGDVRNAAQRWYLGSKDAAVAARSDARALLSWLIDRVIKERKAKAFLIEANVRDPIVDFLYDERVLHVLRKGMSAKDQPGKRFNVYGIDYGCYVDLISTANAPQGMLDLGEESAEHVSEVPHTDLRSIRRCVLELPDFYASGINPLLT